MKILITTEFYLPFVCGITTAVIDERKALTALGHEVRVFTISSDNESFFRDGVYYIRQNIPQLYKDSYASVALNDDLLDDIIEWAPDIVHAQNEFFTFLFAKKISKKLQTPLILTCHTDYPSYGYNFIKSKTVWDALCRQFIPKLISPCNALLCSTKKIHDLMVSYSPKAPVLMLRLGVDLDKFGCDLSDNEFYTLRKENRIPDGSFVFISVCRLSKEKQVDKCIEVFRHVHEKFNMTHLLIVGDGQEKENLVSLAESYSLQDCISFTGEIASDDVWKYYRIANCFLNASESETQGLTFIEALASGVPVICRDNPVNSSFLMPGVNGYSYRNQTEFLSLCCMLVSDPGLLNMLHENAPASVDSYSLQTFGKNLDTLFNIALKEEWKEGETIPENSEAMSVFGEINE